MSAPFDQAVRALALDPTRSFIVQAPAGSGKTELLTRRVLTLLCCVDEPEEIMAITFTKKAAGEMRQRVVDALLFASDNPSVDDKYKQEGVELALEVLERDRQLGWHLTRNPQRLNLRTIDSLATQLAHRLPVTSTLGAPTAMIENADALYQEAAQRFIESNMGSMDLLLLLLGNKLERAQKLFAELLGKRDQWRRHVYAADADDHQQLRALLEGMLADLVESRLEHLVALTPASAQQVLPIHLPRAYEFALALAEGDVGELPEPMQDWYFLTSMPGKDLEDLSAWSSVAHALLTDNGDLRKQVNKRLGFPTSKADAKAIGVESAVLTGHKQRLVDLLEELHDAPNFCDALREVRKLPSPIYKDEQWALLSQLLTVLPDLLLQLQLVFASHATVDFSEISARAALALGTDEAPTDLALSMDLSLRHLLVDEFQDTSQTQFRLFEQLIRPWQSGDGRTFFAVGDPMQSIYRFREGDVALFTQVQNQGIGGAKVEALTLSVNFRSSPVVTDWVNTCFSEIFPKHVDTDTGAIPFSHSQAFRDDAGQVLVHPLIDVDKDYEANVVARICQSAVSEDKAHQVAILVRSRTQATEIFAALRKHELAYAAIDMDLVGERPVVKDLITLVMALRYPHDRLHWLALLRAPFVGLKLHDLYKVVAQVSTRTAVIQCLKDKEIIEQLSVDGQQRVERLMKVVEPAVEQCRRSRIMPWVESLWLSLGGPIVCADALDEDAADRALALLYRLESQGDLWRKSTIEASMGKLFAKPVDAKLCQIQVMTLHKSKGLEFDTVILPALDRRSRADGTQLLNWFEGTFNGEPKLLLAPFEQAGANRFQKDRLIKLVKSANDRCAAQEKLRLLYVACTRAVKNLHLVARVSTNVNNELVKPNDVSLLAPLWKVLESDYKALHKAMMLDAKTAEADDTEKETVKESNQHPQQLSLDVETPDSKSSEVSLSSLAQIPEGPSLSRLPSNTLVPALDIFRSLPVKATDEKSVKDSIQYLWAGSDARSIGTVVHEQLQYLAEQHGIASKAGTQAVSTQKQTAVIERQLQNLGVGALGLEAAVNKVNKALANTLDDERGRWILQDHEQARNEWALTVPGNTRMDTSSGSVPDNFQRVVIDRTFVGRDGVRWIIDYKTSDHEGGAVDAFLDEEQNRYADQLNRYAGIIGLVDKRPIRLGLYFPMFKGWREWQVVTQSLPPSD